MRVKLSVVRDKEVMNKVNKAIFDSLTPNITYLGGYGFCCLGVWVVHSFVLQWIIIHIFLYVCILYIYTSHVRAGEIS